MRVLLHCEDDARPLAAMFPAMALHPVGTRPAGAITGEAWAAESFDFWAFDRALDRALADDREIAISGSGAFARQLLTRAQRLAPRRNAATAGTWFDRVLAAHTAVHDVRKPLVQADLDHARDAWQWTLRLDEHAPAAVQLAALLHDVERLRREADARVEHRAADYQAFEHAHAVAGARMARSLLAAAAVDVTLIAEVVALIEVHERRADEPALRALGDADALSFFSFDSPGYLAYFGGEQTARKVAYTHARMSARARAELPALRLPGAVRAMLAAQGGAPGGDDDGLD